MNDEINKKLFLAIIIGATFAIIAFGLGVYYFDKKIINKNTQLEIVASDDANNWSIYDNKRYDFSIKKPSGFIDSELENDTGMLFSKNNNNIKVSAFSNAQGKTTEEYLSEEFNKISLNNYKIIGNISENVTIDNCKFDVRDWEFITNDNKDKIIKKYVCLKDDIFYIVELETTPESLNEYEVIFNKVINSIDIR
mgnify:FL=1